MTIIENNDYHRIMAVAKKRGPIDYELVHKAEQFARNIHRDETRLSKDAFITHPWAVARMIADMDLETSLIAAALLHDVLEHGADLNELKRQFDPEVTDTVINLTINKGNSDSVERHLAYNDQLTDKAESDLAPVYLKQDLIKAKNETIVTKYNVPLYDIFLIVRDKCRDDLIPFFLSFYKELSARESILITHIQPKQDEPCRRLILEDRFKNQYCLALFYQMDYEIYLYGCNPKHARYLPSRYIPESKSSAINIRVITRNGDMKKIMRGATVLDFAFLIHENIGLCAQYGIVNGETVSLDTALNEDDRIEIIPARKGGEYQVCAQFRWFEFVKTPRAVHLLTRWFEKNYIRKPEEEMLHS